MSLTRSGGRQILGSTPFLQIISSTLREVAHFGLCQMVTGIYFFFRDATPALGAQRTYTPVP